MSATKWWAYVERLLGDDTPKDAADKAGFSRSNFTRWRDGANAEPLAAVKLARAYHANVVEALVAAGLITDDEAQLKEVRVGLREALETAEAQQLADELVARAERAEELSAITGSSAGLRLVAHRRDPHRGEKGVEPDEDA